MFLNVFNWKSIYILHLQSNSKIPENLTLNLTVSVVADCHRVLMVQEFTAKWQVIKIQRKKTVNI